MKKIAVVDSGINYEALRTDKVIESYKLIPKDDDYTIQVCEPIDYIGHGTAVAKLILDENKDVELISFCICEQEMTVDESALIFILDYIHHNIKSIDIINMSLGLTYISRYKELAEICDILSSEGVLLVSAFDNDGAISYPAALESVIGIGVTESYTNRKQLFWQKNSIVDIKVPDIFFRTIWNNEKTILKGSSFACGKISGILSLIDDRSLSKNDILSRIATDCEEIVPSIPFDVPNFEIHKAVIFPLNKESQAIIRFRDLLGFEISGVYDDKLSGKVGNSFEGYLIESFDKIDWEKHDFDTVILSCSSTLSSITRKNYSDIVICNAKKYGINVYSFENSRTDYERFFYPRILSDMTPKQNDMKLFKSLLPTIGVMGTSSKQGKFTVQLELIRRLKKIGYNVGHIATEPSGFLFGADFVYHFGYHANLSIMPWESIAMLNEMIKQVQVKEKDVLIVGSQSNTLHYTNSCIDDFKMDQYALLLGTLPDFVILCANIHDNIQYLLRTINFINSIDEGKVMAVVLFPVKVVETVNCVSFKEIVVDEVEMEERKNYLRENLKLPIYSLNDQADLDGLCSQVIDFFAE